MLAAQERRDVVLRDPHDGGHLPLRGALPDMPSKSSYLTHRPACGLLCRMQDRNATLLFKSRQEQRVEHEQGERIDALLRRLYQDERLTQDQVAERLGVGRAAVLRWMVKYEIPTRDRRALAPTEAVA